MLIKDLKNIAQDINSGSYQDLKELVDLGFLNYSKLTSVNYCYWWYETTGEIDKNMFTFKKQDCQYTRKFKVLEKYIDYHNENENGYLLINNALNIINCTDDDYSVGLDELLDFLGYKNKQVYKQLRLEF